MRFAAWRCRWYFRLRPVLSPIATLSQRWQVIIRCCSMAGWVVEHLEARSDIYRAARRGHRAAVLLCLLSRQHPRRADDVARLVLDRWSTSAAILSAAELRTAPSAEAAQ